MKRLFAFLFAAVLAGAQQPASVDGTAVNSATKGPVAKAVVTLHNAEKNFAYSAIADDAGRFRISNVEPATGYFVTAEAPGFTVDSTSHSKVFTVSENQNVTGILAPLTPGGSISGKVVDGNEDPVTGAQVALMRYGYETGKRQLQTTATQAADDRGEYRFGAIPPGRYYVFVTPPVRVPDPPGRMHRTTPDTEFAPAYYPGAAEVSGAAPIDLAPGGEAGGMNFRLRKNRLFHVRGQVAGFRRLEDYQGSPRVVAPVFVDHCGQDRESHYTVAPDGTFDVAHIAPGSYCITVPIAQGTARATITVADRDLENITLTISPNFDVKGSVSVESGLAGDLSRIGMRFAPVETGGAYPNSGPIEPDGSFVIRSVQAIAYALEQTDPAPNTYLKSVSVNGREAAPARINFTSGGDVFNLLFGSDVGQVTGSADSGGITVVIAPVDPLSGRERVRWAMSDGNGKFNIPALAPGDYKVYAFEKIDFYSMAAPDYRQVFDAMSTPVTVHSNGHETVDVKTITAEQAAEALKKLR